MENNINLNNGMHPYLLQFNYALVNFSKFVEEQRLEKRKKRRRQDTRRLV